MSPRGVLPHTRSVCFSSQLFLKDAVLPFLSLLTWLTAPHPQPSADPVLLGVWRPSAHRQEASPVQELPEAGF